MSTIPFAWFLRGCCFCDIPVSSTSSIVLTLLRFYTKEWLTFPVVIGARLPLSPDVAQHVLVRRLQTRRNGGGVGPLVLRAETVVVLAQSLW